MMSVKNTAMKVFAIRRRVAATVVVGTAAVAIAVLPTLAPAATLEEKRAEAARVSAQVDALDTEYDHLQERYRGAQYRLGDLNRVIGETTTSLKRTQGELDVARERLVVRAVSVYKQGANGTRLVNLVQAGSIESFFTRINTIEQVSKQDAEILEEIRALRGKIARKKAQLKEARVEQVAVVKQAKRDKAAMKKKLDARTAVLAGVNSEIRQMIEQERQRKLAAARAAAQRQAATPRTGGGATPARSDAGTAFSSGGAAPPASGAAARAAGVAMGQLGVPYVWGGASPSGFDCSGLVMWSFAQVGISLPHSTYALWNMGTHVDRASLQSGDLVFFSGLGHMGIYVGGGSFVHAPHSGDVVKVSSMNDSYGQSAYVGAVRIS